MEIQRSGQRWSQVLNLWPQAAQPRWSLSVINTIPIKQLNTLPWIPAENDSGASGFLLQVSPFRQLT